MVIFLNSFVLLMAVVIAAEGHDWDYKQNGADWPNLYPTCGKKN
jgi:hypothetical protein